MEMTRKCPICGAPYKVFMHTVADQSACPDCVSEAERRVRNPTSDERAMQRLKRMRFFGETP